VRTFLLLPLLFLLGCGETKVYEFENFTQANELIKKGWVPTWVSSNAENIKIKYNIDSNCIIGTFNISNEFVPPNTYSRTEMHNLEVPRLNASWFQSFPMKETVPNYHCFKHIEQNSFIAATKTSNQVYFWSN
jgi:hypothetical protein